MTEPHEAAPAGWLFVTPSAVPVQWQERAVMVAFVPLLAAELSALLARDAVAVAAAPEATTRLLALVAGGATKSRMARELNVSVRTVERRLSELKVRFGASSLAELAAIGARLGLG